VKKLILIVAFTLVFLMIPLAYADDVVDISELPQRFAEALNIPVFAGQILVSVLFMSFFMFPTIFISAWTKSKDIMMPCLFVGISTLGICVAIGWLPIWLFTILCLFIALMYSSKIVGVFKG
jgi:hypothetical protein